MINTCTSNWSNAVLIEGKSFIQCMLADLLVKDIRPSEVQQGTKVLIVREESVQKQNRTKSDQRSQDLRRT